MMRRVWVCGLCIAMILAMGSVWAEAAGTKVTRCNVRLRKQAHTGSDTLATISGGTEIVVLGASGGWTKTKYNGHTGYVAAENLMELTRSGYYPLREGDENPYVREMQKRLADLGYYEGSADGKYGASTLTAVKSFQKNNNIKQDGVAGGETQRIMFSDGAKAAFGAPVAAAA
ncbi:MAG: peptidoglycan-binding protein, partial [Firmicutes bacterium]|nr:peptidoglycan-binding protein [Bacillota bacterium]